MVRKEVRNSSKKVGSSRLGGIIFSPVRTVPACEVPDETSGTHGRESHSSTNFIAAWHQIQS